jgi:hypothetical protein
MHRTAGHSQNVEVDGAKKSALSTTGSREVAFTAEGSPSMVGIAAVTATAPVVAGDHSMGVQGSMRTFSSRMGNEGGLQADTVSAAAVSSHEVQGGSDASPNDGHRMLSATPTSLEVGVANGSHGWLKIRAELADGGVVNASVTATSSAGQEMLHRELPSLTAYLQSERLGVNTVAVHAAAATTETRDFSGAMSNRAEDGQTGQGGSSQSGDARQGFAASDSDRMDEPGPFAGSKGAEADVLSTAVYGEGGSGGGGWISVMA